MSKQTEEDIQSKIAKEKEKIEKSKENMRQNKRALQKIKNKRYQETYSLIGIYAVERIGLKKSIEALKDNDMKIFDVIVNHCKEKSENPFLVDFLDWIEPKKAEEIFGIPNPHEECMRRISNQKMLENNEVDGD